MPIASYNLYRIRKLRPSLTIEACKQVVHGLVLSHLDYCNSLYIGLPTVDLNRLQRIQNAAARLVLMKSNYSNPKVLLKELHWLPIMYRIKYKVLTIVFHCIHGSAPQYLQRHIQLKSPSQYHLRSNSHACILQVPQTRAATFAANSFSVYGPREWNKLPTELRVCPDFAKFRKDLKTYLFSFAYM